MLENEIEPDRNKLPPWLIPLSGGLTAFTVLGYLKLFGNVNGPLLAPAMWIILGAAAWKALVFIEAADSHELCGAAPNRNLTIFLLIASVFLFWIPLFGLVLVSYALYRSRWLKSDRLLFPISCLFFLSLGVTITIAFIIAIDG